MCIGSLAGEDWDWRSGEAAWYGGVRTGYEVNQFKKDEKFGNYIEKRERGTDTQFGLLLWKSMWENAREPENENKMIKDGESVLSLRDQSCGILAWKKRR